MCRREYFEGVHRWEEESEERGGGTHAMTTAALIIATGPSSYYFLLHFIPIYLCLFRSGGSQERSYTGLGRRLDGTCRASI